MKISFYDHRLFVNKLLIMGLGLVFSGCVQIPAQIAQPKPYFNWEPQGQETPQKISIALVSPAFGTDSKFLSYNKNKYLTVFLDSLQTDLQKSLLAKGFAVHGPFESFDIMTFPNKQDTDLALVPEVVLILDENYTENYQYPEGPYYKMTGTVTVSGFARFTLIEPISEQKIWIKKVNLPDQSENILVDLLYTNGKFNNFHANKDNRDAALVDALNKIYPKIMQQFWNYLNADEIKMLRKASKDARALKRF